MSSNLAARHKDGRTAVVVKRMRRQRADVVHAP